MYHRATENARLKKHRNLLHVTGNIVYVEQIHVAYPLYLSAVWTTFK